MKKVLLLFNGISSPVNLLSFINKNLDGGGKLFHAIFINKLHTDPALDYPFPNDLTATAVDYTYEEEAAEANRLVYANIRYFEDECRNKNLAFKTDFYAEASHEHLIRESLFADLILSERGTEFDDYSIRDLLAKAHCPILLVSPERTRIRDVVLAYDGSSNSMYAIRQFAYLLPELKGLQTCLLTVTGDEGESSLNQSLINDWLAQHFSDYTIQILQGRPADELVSFINEAGNAIVVMGAFGRNALSRWFQGSHAEKVLSETHASVFIAHVPS